MLQVEPVLVSSETAVPTAKLAVLLFLGGKVQSEILRSE